MVIKDSSDHAVQKLKAFAVYLLNWHKTANHRTMPWKGEKDPYKIWLSEIILQQTRVEQGLAYYEKFILHYPTVKDLASAEDNQVFKDWEGLGYYNRCKNLLHTARRITEEFNGQFPNTYEGLLELKGIGPYTAAAISAFAYNLPYAVVDGNVFRVLSRVYGIDLPIDSTQGKSFFEQLAAANLDKKYPALYNQAIMDFGATVCRPANPKCSACPMVSFCLAYQTGSVNRLPVKEKVLQKKVRHLTWLIIEAEGLYYIRKRPAGDIWQNLHEFFLIETLARMDWNEQQLVSLIQDQLAVAGASVTFISDQIQQLTHQKIVARFFHAKLPRKPVSLPKNQWFSKKELHQLAFPKMLKELDFLAAPK